jgi:hypothetical protein
MSAIFQKIYPHRSLSSSSHLSDGPRAHPAVPLPAGASAPGRKLSRVLATAATALVASVWLGSCATDRLESTAPKGIDLSGDWQLDPNLSDDPAKPPLNDGTSPSQMRHRSGRGRGSGSIGLPPFGNPGGAGGPTGGAQPDGTEDFTSNGSVQGPYVRTLWQNPSGTGAGGGGATAGGGTNSSARGGRANRWLDAPVRMTIAQKGDRLTIQSKSSGGEVQTDELVPGHSSGIPIGQNTADRDVGWRGDILVVDTKVKSGPTKEDDYALDDEGHLIVSTFISGSYVRKSQIKRVYDRVSNAEGVRP